MNNEIIRPTKVEVNISTISQNFFNIKNFKPKSKIMAILKANAYGHGLVRIAIEMERLGVDYIGVAVLEEGITLRENGITKPILVLGGIIGNQIPLFLNYNLTITASSITKLQQINDVAGSLNLPAKVHLKIDTGMERIGVHYYNAETFIQKSFEFENIKVEGIYSHFSNADSANLGHSYLQLERFMRIKKFADKISDEKVLFHIANSAAILQIPESDFDMIRPGILLFGVYPSAKTKKTIDVEPALSWKSRVVYFKVIKPNHPVGYGLTWQTNKNIRAVTIPVGYGDGYFRSMSQKAKVIINDKIYPIIGNISMDQIVVNIDKDSAYNGDEVILIGRSKKLKITCEDLALWANTIPYEILTNINTRVPRVYLH